MDSYPSSYFDASGYYYRHLVAGGNAQGPQVCQPDQGEAPLDSTIYAWNNFPFSPMLVQCDGYLYPAVYSQASPPMVEPEPIETERPSSRSTHSSSDNLEDLDYVPGHSHSPEYHSSPQVPTASFQGQSQPPRHRRSSNSSASHAFVTANTDLDAARKNLVLYVKEHEGEDIPDALLEALLERKNYPPGTPGRGTRDGAAAYRCRWPDCTRTVVRRDHAKDHVATHVGFKPLPCFSCRRRFLRPYDLTRHGKKCRRRIESGSDNHD